MWEKNRQIILGYKCSWASRTAEAKGNNKWLSLAEADCGAAEKHDATRTQIYKNKTNLRPRRRPRKPFLTASRGRFTTRDSAGRVRKMPPYSPAKTFQRTKEGAKSQNVICTQILSSPPSVARSISLEEPGSSPWGTLTVYLSAPSDTMRTCERITGEIWSGIKTQPQEETKMKRKTAALGLALQLGPHRSSGTLA